MNSYKLSEGLKICFRFSTKLNIYLNNVASWSLIKNNSMKENLYSCVVILYKYMNELGILLEPFMPIIVNKIKEKFILHSQDESYTILLPREKPTIIINPVEDIV